MFVVSIYKEDDRKTIATHARVEANNRVNETYPHVLRDRQEINRLAERSLMQWVKEHRNSLEEFTDDAEDCKNMYIRKFVGSYMDSVAHKDYITRNVSARVLVTEITQEGQDYVYQIRLTDPSRLREAKEFEVVVPREGVVQIREIE